MPTGMTDHFAFLLPFIMFTFSVAFLIVWRSGVPAAGYWAVGYLLNGIACFVPVLLASVPDDPQSIIGDAFFAVSFFFFGQALVVRFRAPSLTRTRLVLVALAIGGSAFSVLMLRSLRVELVVSDLSCSVLIGTVLASVWSRVKRPIDWALMAISGLVIVDNAVCGAVALVAMPTDAVADFMTTDYAFFLQASCAVLGLVFGMTALAAVTLDIVAHYRQEAMSDPLTGLLNRRGFERAAAGLLSRPSPRGSVVICDIDRFKQINDRFGHAAGDKVIARFAAELRATLPEGMIAARFGGEEFVLLLPARALADARFIAEEIRTKVSNQVWTDSGLDAVLTASFGVAAIERGDTSLDAALARADAALYRAKASGRNRIEMAELSRHRAADETRGFGAASLDGVLATG